MLTGDSKAVAERVGKGACVDEVHAELLPEKVEEVERLLAAKSKKQALYSSVTASMTRRYGQSRRGRRDGRSGPDAAIEAADVVIMTDEPSKLFESDGYCQKTLVIAKQNVIFALAVSCWCWCSARSVCQYVGCRIRGCQVSVLAILNGDAGAEDRAK